MAPNPKRRTSFRTKTTSSEIRKAGVDDDGVGVARTSLASYEKPFGTAEDDESNRELVILAVSGDAEVESALERLLAGERSSSAKYVDRALLAGAVLVLTGPVSRPRRRAGRRRCARAGVRVVAAATEGDARAAAERALTLYVATASLSALRAPRPRWRRWRARRTS